MVAHGGGVELRKTKIAAMADHGAVMAGMTINDRQRRHDSVSGRRGGNGIKKDEKEVVMGWGRR